MKRIWIYLLCLLPAVALASPDVRVRTAILGADNAVVGGTVTLQIDVLVDTWFSAAPQLPDLQLEGAVVSPPNGEAVHLTEKQDGKTLFGLRYSYPLTLQEAKAYEIPALPVVVSAGEASQPVTVNTSVQRFTVTEPSGVQPGEAVLVARAVDISQILTLSHDPLRVGDSVTREVRVRATDAQAMLIPAPDFPEIKGLARYPQPPSVHPLDDGRGGVSGGAREDSVIYRVTEQGQFHLPAIELKWWSVGDRQVHVATAAQTTLEARGNGAYQAPFSVEEDLRALRHNAQVSIARHWLGMAAGLILAAACFYLGRPRVQWLLHRWRDVRALRKRQWLQSSEYAWRQARQQLSATSPRLDGLYLWVKRRWGQPDLLSFAQCRAPSLTQPLQQVLDTAYGRASTSAPGFATLAASLDALPANARTPKRSGPKEHGLKPLNPGSLNEVADD